MNFTSLQGNLSASWGIGIRQIDSPVGYGCDERATSGCFVVDDIDIYRLKSEKRADFRREFLGFVFQSFHLVPYLTVIENVMLPLAIVKASGKKKRLMAESAWQPSVSKARAIVCRTRYPAVKKKGSPLPGPS